MDPDTRLRLSLAFNVDIVAEDINSTRNGNDFVTTAHHTAEAAPMARVIGLDMNHDVRHEVNTEYSKKNHAPNASSIDARRSLCSTTRCLARASSSSRHNFSGSHVYYYYDDATENAAKKGQQKKALIVTPDISHTDWCGPGSQWKEAVAATPEKDRNGTRWARRQQGSPNYPHHTPTIVLWCDKSVFPNHHHSQSHCCRHRPGVHQIFPLEDAYAEELRQRVLLRSGQSIGLQEFGKDSENKNPTQHLYEQTTTYFCSDPIRFSLCYFPSVRTEPRDSSPSPGDSTDTHHDLKHHTNTFIR